MMARSSIRWCACAAILIGAASCKNSQYCAGNPGNNCDLMWEDAGSGSDGPDGCTGDPQCSGATAVCDTSNMTCVQCTMGEATACTGTTPVCGSNDTCGACTAHGQCASDACLPDGSCSDGSNVAYVAPTGSGTQCTMAAPCSSVANALATNRPYVKFAGTTDSGPAGVTVNSGRTVTFLADPGAVLTRSSGTGAIVTVSDDSTSLTVFDLSISNAPNNASGYGIVIPSASGSPAVSLTRATISNNPAGGISASGGTLTVEQSKITGNSGGGISLTSAQFTIVNNFVAKNGGATSFYGGIQLSNVAASGTHAINFNTIADNSGASSVDTGITCSSVLTALAFDSNIVYGNIVAASGTQIGGTNCGCTYCDVGPDNFTGTGNINMDPMFVNASLGDYHIMSSSPCKDTADPSATLDVDIDGETRPQGPARDIGADEFKQ